MPFGARALLFPFPPHAWLFINDLDKESISFKGFAEIALFHSKEKGRRRQPRLHQPLEWGQRAAMAETESHIAPLSVLLAAKKEFRSAWSERDLNPERTSAAIRFSAAPPIRARSLSAGE